jgi:serine phosphatase RsbU (regulator of sigma subunit)/anti-sigma regulatory factor (Ser/Thr protein kinase)
VPRHLETARRGLLPAAPHTTQREGNGTRSNGIGDESKPRLHRLADAAVALNTTLAVPEVLDRVTLHARDIIGAHQALAGFAPRSGDEVAVAAESLSPWNRRHGRLHGSPLDVALCDLVCATNRPLRLSRRALRMDPEWRAVADDGGLPDGLLAAPLMGRDGRNIGVLRLADPYEEVFTADDEAVLVQLAQMASIAVENASVFERERATARGLQRQLLPHRLPSVDGLETAGRYVAGGHGVEVGGDWYDVLDRGDGRATLVIGDVMGRGVHAASVMGQLRVVLRAYALEGMRPSDALAALARLVDSLDGDYFVTCLCAHWDLRTSTLTFANAGHPPPLLRLGDGTVRYLRGTQGVPIGVDPAPRYVEHRVDAPAGSTLLLFTDGLVEHRDLPIDVTLDTLARAAGEAAASPEDLAERVLEAMPAATGDDVALLVAHRPGGRDPVLPLRDCGDELWLAASPANVSHARQWVTRRLDACGAQDAIDIVVLLTSEIVTNAIVHAQTPLTLRVEPVEGGVRVAVSDGDPEVPAMGEFNLHSSGGRGMALLDTLAEDWGVQVERNGKTVWFDVGS